MVLGATYLCNDHGINVPSILWHSRFIDKIHCIANDPSPQLEETLTELSRKIPQFKYLGADRTDILTNFYKKGFYAFHQCRMVDQMIASLGEVDRVLNIDDDEFYVGPVREVLENRPEDILYQDGYCFYDTTLDDVNEKNAVRRMRYRDPETADYAFRKAMHTMTGWVSTTHGNHYCNWNGQPTIGRCPEIKIYHYRGRKAYYLPGTYHIKDEAFIKDNNLIYDDILIKQFDELGIQ